MTASLLDIENLSVEYRQHRETTLAVKNVSLTLGPGETVALVGESGCGKSTLGLSILGLLPKDESAISSGAIRWEGRSLYDQSSDAWQKWRGKEAAMVFQDPFSSFNPVLTIGEQLDECLVLETGRDDTAHVIEQLRRVHFDDPERMYRSYPHQVSGGQRQRAMLAMALLRNPKLLIADEPTTALDVTVQDEILKLLIELQRDYKMAMIFITHNFGLVKNIAHRVVVMRRGEIVEEGTTERMLKNPTHPYTRGLIRCLPTLVPSTEPLPTLEETV